MIYIKNYCFFLFIFFSINNIVLGADSVCPGGGLSSNKGDKPYKLIKINENLEVMVCGRHVEKIISDIKFIINEFNIYYINKGRAANIFEASCLDDRIVTIDQKNKNLFLDESIYINSKEYPFLHSELQCTKTECKISESICVLKPEKVQAPSSLELVKKEKDFLKKMQKTPDFIWKIFDAAMIGDKKSQEFIEKTDFKAWEGHEGEGIASAQNLYILAKRKCKL